MTGHEADAEVTVQAPPERVWETLTDPDLIATYMFGTQVETDWQPGSAITWNGEWDGRAYQDKGEIVSVTPRERLELTHFSPLTGAEDVPENYHRLVYTLRAEGAGTVLHLTQDNNSSEEEARHSAENWQQMLDGLTKVAEQS